MAQLNNPAGRLHALLSDYQRVAASNRSILSTWADVLSVSPDGVPEELCAVASLISDIRMAIEATGDIDQLELFRHFSPAWIDAIIFTERNGTQIPSPGRGFVQSTALISLASLSSFLSVVSPEPITPSVDTLEEIRGRLVEAVDLTASSTDVPDDVRHLLLDRLYDIVSAVDRIRIGGSGAVTAAMEALAGAVAIRVTGNKRTPTVRQVLAIVGAAWTIFLTGAQVDNALTGWEGVIGRIESADGPASTGQ